MIAVEEAKRILLAEAGPLDVVEVGLDEALGKVLAEQLVADRDQPPTDRSAMDGYAVRADDLADAPRTLKYAGEVRAGQPVGDVRVRQGEAVRILTGAIIPPGADTVVMVEKTEEDREKGEVKFLESPDKGQHIRRRGEDSRRGDEVLPAGVLIQAAEIAALAAVGKVRVKVHRLPRVHVLSTGDEVIEPDETPADHQVRNSNAGALLAQLSEMSIAGTYLGIAPDSHEELQKALRQGLSGDLLLITGGVSVGAYDLVGEVLESLGMHLLFHKVAMRPGKPILAGRCRDCLVVGLPGNPVSAFTGFVVLVAPVLRSMMGLERVDGLEVQAVLKEPLPPKRGRTTFHLARVEWNDDRWTARPVRNVSSGDVLSLVRANAYLVTPPDAQALDPGSVVSVFLWKDSYLRASVSRR